MSIVSSTDVVAELLVQRDNLSKAFAAVDQMARQEQQRYTRLVYVVCELVNGWTPPYSPKEQAVIDALAELDKC